MTDKPDRRKLAPPSDAKTVTALTAKAGISLFPGGEYLSDLMFSRLDQLRESHRKKQEERLELFYSELLNSDAGMDEQVAAAMVDDRDFHALLQAALNEIEEEKTGSYAVLARSIAVGRVEQSWRRHYILALRDLSEFDLDLMRRAYVARRHELVPGYGGGRVSESEFFEPSNNNVNKRTIAISSLVTRGFVQNKKLSDVGEGFIAACTSTIKLTPAGMGFRVWSNRQISIVTYELDVPEIASLAERVGSKLHTLGVKSSIFALRDRDIQQVRAFTTDSILLIGKHIDRVREHAAVLDRLSKKCPFILVFVDTPPQSLPSEITVRSISSSVEIDDIVQCLNVPC